MRQDGLDRNPERVYLKIENPDDEELIDLLNIVSAMGRRRKLYFYCIILAACAGICLGLAVVGVRHIKGEDSRASAAVRFQYKGIENGLDPDGEAFDINKLKSPTVIGEALAELGITDISVEDVRSNIVIEGVVPEDALQRITVINEMANTDASNYEKLLDVSYFPSQYIVHLYKGKNMSPSDTAAILNAVLDSYRNFFLDTYADTEALSVTSRLIDYTEYDYMEAVDMLQSQIEIMQDYVADRRRQAPDFRSSGTGLTFGDIEASLDNLEEIELSKIASYIESTALTKDRENFEEQYGYKIRRYNMKISELQAQLATVEATINSYEKDPVVIVSAQESKQEISRKNQYYDTLVERKLTLNREIAAVNTHLNEAYELWNRVMSSDAGGNTQEQYEYADGMLRKLGTTMAEWVRLTEETTQEYYSTTLFSNAYKVAVPAQYHAADGLTDIVKLPMLCAAALAFVVVVIWCADGFRQEMTASGGKKGE